MQRWRRPASRRQRRLRQRSLPGGCSSTAIIFGCCRQGYAGQLLQQAIADARAQGRKGLVLTCKEALVHYYAKFGFVNEGVSGSTHGGVVWYQMRL